MINKIFNEDCLVGMQRIPDKSINMILCDLPYGTTKNKWDSIIPLSELWSNYCRIIKDNGSIVLTAQTPFDKVLGASKVDLLKYEYVWNKKRPTGHLNSKFAPMKQHENILIFSKASACFVKDKSKAMVFNPQFRKGEPYTCRNGKASSNYDTKNYEQVITVNDGNYYPISILEFSPETGLHPTQKPVPLFEYLIRTYSNENDIILDNCMGSGTTAIAAINTNRKYIGFEMDKTYFDIAQERIQNAQTLFS